jgi:acetoin utilization deacetylase AcuC-like enzyme
MLTVFTEDHRFQDGKFELIDGQFLPPFERPQRAEMIIERVRDVGLGDVIGPAEFGLDPVRRVHSDKFITFLQTAHGEWRKVHGDTDALPLTWPSRGFRQIEPEAIDGKLSYYSFDAGTPITSGTWRAVTAAANVALTGAQRINDGAHAVFSLCRPPGHHAARDLYAGYCFLNNAAIAAQWFLDQGAARVAVLDVDYHHGNGTQMIFYDRADVLFVSLHGHPAQEYPYFLGYKDETGEGAGEGYNVNLPMRWGANWGIYSDALETAFASIRSYAPDVLVVSLGVDTFEKDPISHFRLTSENYPEIGRRIAGLSLNTLFVMEGGYAVEEIGINAIGVLSGFEANK